MKEHSKKIVLLVLACICQPLLVWGTIMDTIVVKVHFPSGGNIILNYQDQNFISHEAKFSNPSSNDTTIIKKIISANPIHAFIYNPSNSISEKKILSNFTNYIFMPKDEVLLNVAGFRIEKIGNKPDIDSLMGFNTQAPIIFNSQEFNSTNYKSIPQILDRIETEHNSVIIKLNEIVKNNKLDKSRSNMLYAFNDLSKYYKISSLFFNNSIPVSFVKAYFGKYYDEMTLDLNGLFRINSVFNNRILYFMINYKAFVENKFSNDFWSYFECATPALKATEYYKSYIVSYLSNDNSVKNLAQLKTRIAEINRKGFKDKRLEEMFFQRQRATNLPMSIGLIDEKKQLNSYNKILSSFKGKYIFVDFWASWCGPCRNQMPSLHKKKGKFNDNDIEFISISIDADDKENFNNWIAASRDEKLIDNNYKLIGGPKNELLKLLNFKTVPRYVLYDRNGTLIDNDFLAPDNERFVDVLMNLVKSLPKEED